MEPGKQNSEAFVSNKIHQFFHHKDLQNLFDKGSLLLDLSTHTMEVFFFPFVPKQEPSVRKQIPTCLCDRFAVGV